MSRRKQTHRNVTRCDDDSGRIVITVNDSSATRDVVQPYHNVSQKDRAKKILHVVKEDATLELSDEAVENLISAWGGIIEINLIDDSAIKKALYDLGIGDKSESLARTAIALPYHHRSDLVATTLKRMTMKDSFQTSLDHSFPRDILVDDPMLCNWGIAELRDEIRIIPTKCDCTKGLWSIVKSRCSCQQEDSLTKIYENLKDTIDSRIEVEPNRITVEDQILDGIMQDTKLTYENIANVLLDVPAEATRDTVEAVNGSTILANTNHDHCYTKNPVHVSNPNHSLPPPVNITKTKRIKKTSKGAIRKGSRKAVKCPSQERTASKQLIPVEHKERPVALKTYAGKKSKQIKSA